MIQTKAATAVARHAKLDPFKGDMVPTTRAPRFIHRGMATGFYTQEDPSVLRYWAKNCRLLAELMAQLPQDKHKQDDWACAADWDEYTYLPVTNSCGTKACAMGWAALTHMIPGLQFTLTDDEHAPGKKEFHPALNGVMVGNGTGGWVKVGKMFFGNEAANNVFAMASLDKDTIVSMLLQIAGQYERRAEKLA